MSEYIPDAWVIVRITTDNDSVDKILAGWYGGYLGSNSWKLSSGIVNHQEDGDVIKFLNHSGSIYICNTHAERMTGLTSSIFSSWKEEIKDRDGVSMEIIDYEDWKPK